MKHLLLTTIAAVLLVGTAFADPIHEAAANGDLAGVGADVNAKEEDGWTPLHYAVYEGYKEIAELLIAKGADVNAKEEDGWTPLHDAATKEIAELLIDNGADVNAKDGTGSTALDTAEEATANLLRKHGGKTGEELKAEGK